MTKKNKDDNEDIIIEEEFTEDSSAGEKYNKKISSLKTKLEKCQEEKAEYLQGWQRSQADFINYKKNNASVFSQAKEVSEIALIESLLPVLDSFEMALNGTFDETFQKWLSGFEYIHQQFKRVLSEYNIEEINPIQQTFSPQFHEALEEVPTQDESLDGTVATVILKGYKTITGRIIRAAQVKVYKFDK